MKITASKDFGNSTKNKIVLPLVPEPTEIAKKEDLTQVDLLSDPATDTSTKVRFIFKVIEGAVNPPREVLAWRRNVERAFIGLNSDTGTAKHQMLQQFCRGTALSTYNNHINKSFLAGKNTDLKTAEKAVADDDGSDAAVLAALEATVTAVEGRNEAYYLASGDGNYLVEEALNHMMTTLLPNKILQRVKRYLRREARKPFDMNVKEYYMHIQRINNEEIPRLPPLFERSQSLGPDEEIDILLFGTPKSWQREMDRQGFDPLLHTPTEVVDFMERIENSEEFDNDKKNTKTANNNKEKKRNGKGDSNDKGSKYCMMHGNNNTHDTSECKTLKAQVKKLKGDGNENSNYDGKSKNKTWKNKSKESTGDSKKELAALTKQVASLTKKLELNAIEPVKKRKVKWPSEEDVDLNVSDIELKEFNYGDLDQMDIIDEAEDGEVVSVSDEVSV